MPLGSLISPLNSDFIKNWPGQNAANCDNIDAYAGPSLRSDALQTYTPALTGATTNPTLGTGGVADGWYYQIFDQIYTWGEIRFGTAGINVGGGLYFVNLPFTAKTSLAISNTLGKNPVVGTGMLWDDSAAATRQPLTVHLASTTQIMFGTRNQGSTRAVASSGIIAWAVNDGISWFARYQRA